jgi:hypothetical protein
MTFQLAVTAAEAFERLRPLAMLGGDAYIDGEIYDSAGAITAAELTWIKAGNRQHKDWDNTTLGTLRLDRERLVVEVNSRRRRELDPDGSDPNRELTACTLRHVPFRTPLTGRLV